MDRVLLLLTYLIGLVNQGGGGGYGRKIRSRIETSRAILRPRHKAQISRHSVSPIDTHHSRATLLIQEPFSLTKGTGVSCLPFPVCMCVIYVHVLHVCGHVKVHVEA